MGVKQYICFWQILKDTSLEKNKQEEDRGSCTILMTHPNTLLRLGRSHSLGVSVKLFDRHLKSPCNDVLRK